MVDVVIFNNQQCDRSVAMLVIDKVLPTVLEVVADRLKNGKSQEDAEQAAIAVVNAVIKSISVKALRESEDSPLVDAWPKREPTTAKSTSLNRAEEPGRAGESSAPAGTQANQHQPPQSVEGSRSPFSYEFVGDDLRITLKGFR